MHLVGEFGEGDTIVGAAAGVVELCGDEVLGEQTLSDDFSGSIGR